MVKSSLSTFNRNTESKDMSIIKEIEQKKMKLISIFAG